VQDEKASKWSKSLSALSTLGASGTGARFPGGGGNHSYANHQSFGSRGSESTGSGEDSQPWNHNYLQLLQQQNNGQRKTHRRTLSNSLTERNTMTSQSEMGTSTSTRRNPRRASMTQLSSSSRSNMEQSLDFASLSMNILPDHASSRVHLDQQQESAGDLAGSNQTHKSGLRRPSGGCLADPQDVSLSLSQVLIMDDNAASLGAHQHHPTSPDTPSSKTNTKSSPSEKQLEDDSPHKSPSRSKKRSSKNKHSSSKDNEDEDDLAQSSKSRRSSSNNRRSRSKSKSKSSSSSKDKDNDNCDKKSTDIDESSKSKSSRRSKSKSQKSSKSKESKDSHTYDNGSAISGKTNHEPGKKEEDDAGVSLNEVSVVSSTHTTDDKTLAPAAVKPGMDVSEISLDNSSASGTRMRDLSGQTMSTDNSGNNNDDDLVEQMEDNSGGSASTSRGRIGRSMSSSDSRRHQRSHSLNRDPRRGVSRSRSTLSRRPMRRPSSTFQSTLGNSDKDNDNSDSYNDGSMAENSRQGRSMRDSSMRSSSMRDTSIRRRRSASTRRSHSASRRRGAGSALRTRSSNSGDLVSRRPSLDGLDIVLDALEQNGDRNPTMGNGSHNEPKTTTVSLAGLNQLPGTDGGSAARTADDGNESIVSGTESVQSKGSRVGKFAKRMSRTLAFGGKGRSNKGDKEMMDAAAAITAEFGALSDSAEGFFEEDTDKDGSNKSHEHRLPPRKSSFDKFMSKRTGGSVKSKNKSKVNTKDQSPQQDHVAASEEPEFDDLADAVEDKKKKRGSVMSKIKKGVGKRIKRKKKKKSKDGEALESDDSDSETEDVHGSEYSRDSSDQSRSELDDSEALGESSEAGDFAQLQIKGDRAAVAMCDGSNDDELEAVSEEGENSPYTPRRNRNRNIPSRSISRNRRGADRQRQSLAAMLDYSAPAGSTRRVGGDEEHSVQASPARNRLGPRQSPSVMLDHSAPAGSTRRGGNDEESMQVSVSSRLRRRSGRIQRNKSDPMDSSSANHKTKDVKRSQSLIARTPKSEKGKKTKRSKSAGARSSVKKNKKGDEEEPQFDWAAYADTEKEQAAADTEAEETSPEKHDKEKKSKGKKLTGGLSKLVFYHQKVAT
jgi:hypothetical protein